MESKLQIMSSLFTNTTEHFYTETKSTPGFNCFIEKITLFKWYMYLETIEAHVPC